MGLVEMERVGATAILWLSRPPVNALSREMRTAVIEALGRAGREGWAHAAVLLPRAGLGFCAGADLAESAEIRTADDAASVARREIDFCDAICQFPKPLIAAIDRYALGGGLELALTADWRLATPKSKIGFPEAVLGAFPAGGAIPLAVRLIGEVRTRQLMMTGETFEGERALALGLVDEVVEPVRLLERARALGDVFARRAYGSIRAIKTLTRTTLASQREEIVEWMRQIYKTSDIQEGLTAFKARRDPVFDPQWSTTDTAP